MSYPLCPVGNEYSEASPYPDLETQCEIRSVKDSAISGNSGGNIFAVHPADMLRMVLGYSGLYSST